MPRKKPHQPPSYRLHKPTNQAVVTVAKTDLYLGSFGSPASKLRYLQILKEHWAGAASDGTKNASLEGAGILVGEITAAFRMHARTHYVKDGEPTSEIDCMNRALGFVEDLHRYTPVSEFGPVALKQVRVAMIDADLARSVINLHVSRIRHAFRWAVEEQMVPPSVLQGLEAVQGLQRGRSQARETIPVGPVSREDVEAVLPLVPRQVAAMIQIQQLTGCRPGEVVSMRGRDIDRGEVEGVWLFRPASHKTVHHGHSRVIPLGPKAQALIAPFLVDDPDAPLFSPRAAAAESIMKSRKRKRIKPRKASPKRSPGSMYRVDTYRRCIHRACDRAKIERWSPHQLRHTRATELRATYGLDVVRAVLGHRTLKVSDHYAQIDLAKSLRVALAEG